jgi:NitT/TauT family transport system substrate-binding protein
MYRNAVVAALALVATLLLLAGTAEAADAIKLGLSKSTTAGGIFIAKEKGYFAAEGLAPEFILFDSSEPIAVAVASGSVDFGHTGASAGFYTLAGQGALKIIAAASREAPGFRVNGVVASNRAFDAGLHGLKDLGGHSVAISQFGSPPHYSLALIEEKYRVAPQSVRITALQSNPNILSALTGGQVDASVMLAAAMMPAVGRGEMHLLGFVGDEAAWQTGVVFASTKTANDRQDIVERFLRAVRRGKHDYYDAFVDAAGHRRDGANASEILAIMAKYLGQPVEQLEPAIAYVDPDGRLDVKDVLHQVEWFRSQGLVKGSFDAHTVMDTRYVIPLPEN